MRTHAVILAGGDGSRLGPLTANRAKPAVPFAGRYRIIDFTLSNCVNSGVFDVTILAQYHPHSLIKHIGNGEPWDLNRDFTGGVRIFTPYKAREFPVWYQGTANAVLQNILFIKRSHPDLVLILSGDHVYKMDYNPLIAFHLEHGAEATISAMRVPVSEASRFGVVCVDESNRVVSFEEKPARPRSNLVNMGIYLFNPDILEQVLWEDSLCAGSSHDFGKDILPRLVAGRARVFAFPFRGYWMDVGTIASYWQAHLDLLTNAPSLDLNDPSWIIHTRVEERPPARVATGARLCDSMISDGCTIASGAVVERSVLSPGVRVMPGAIVRESVILAETVVGAEAIVERSVVDKRVSIGSGASIGVDGRDGEPRVCVIGKNSSIPAYATLKAGDFLYEEGFLKDFPVDRRPAHAYL